MKEVRWKIGGKNSSHGGMLLPGLLSRLTFNHLSYIPQDPGMALPIFGWAFSHQSRICPYGHTHRPIWWKPFLNCLPSPYMIPTCFKMKQTHVHTHSHTHTHRHTYVHTYEQTHPYPCTHRHTCAYIQKHPLSHRERHTYVHIHRHTHKDTHMCTHTQTRTTTDGEVRGGEQECDHRGYIDPVSNVQS